MNILVTGITSIHGWPLFQHLQKKSSVVVYGMCPVKMARHFKDASHVYACDSEDQAGLRAIIDQVDPAVIIHASGVCDLDVCEDAPDFAHAVNVGGARNIATLAEGRYVVYLSCDLVFSGDEPYAEGYDESHHPDPVSVAGKTYVAAEQEIRTIDNHAIIRIGLPIGPSMTGTKGAIDCIAKRLSTKRPMTLFHDELRSMICMYDLARGLEHFIEKRLTGLYHYGSPETYSLYDIGDHLIRTRGYDPEYLIQISRHDEIDGPPRIGDVTLNSSKFYDAVGFVPKSGMN